MTIKARDLQMFAMGDDVLYIVLVTFNRKKDRKSDIPQLLDKIVPDDAHAIGHYFVQISKKKAAGIYVYRSPGEEDIIGSEEAANILAELLKDKSFRERLCSTDGTANDL